MKTEKKVFKRWWGWDAEKVEKWLEANEENGWSLVKISSMGLWFTFQKGEPRKMAYRIDYQTRVKEDYKQLFKDDNWSLIAQRYGWYYWQQAYITKKPEIFTNTESRIDRNRRLMIILGGALGLQLPSFLVMLAVFLIELPETNTLLFLRHFYGVFIPVQLIVIVLLALIIFKFSQANQRLKQQAKW